MSEVSLELIEKMENELGLPHANTLLMPQEELWAYAELLSNMKG